MFDSNAKFYLKIGYVQKQAKITIFIFLENILKYNLTLSYILYNIVEK